VIRPRIRSLPPALGTRSGEVFELAERLGYTLDDWQRLALNDLLAVDDEGQLAAFEAALLVARQCGKSLIGELYATHSALEGEGVLYTSHRADSSKLIFRRLLASLPAELGADPTYTNGAEEIRFPSDGKIIFRTRGPRVARGFRFSKIAIDEAQVLRVDEFDAMLPTLRTAQDGQLLYLGCAGNGLLNEHCALLYGLRERALRGDSDRLCFVEWSAAAVDGEGNELRADELTEEQPGRREAVAAGEARLRRANPHLTNARRARGPRRDLVRGGVVSVWIPPNLEGLGAGPVSQAEWDALIDPESELDPEQEIHDVIVFFDMSRARQCSLALVGRRVDAALHLDFAGRYEGSVRSVTGHRRDLLA